MKKIFDEKLIDEISRMEVDLPAYDWDLLAAKIPAKPVKRKFAWWYAVAASVAVLLVIGGVGLYYLGGSEEKPLIAQIEPAKVSNQSTESQSVEMESTEQETIVNETYREKKSLHNNINVEKESVKSNSEKKPFTQKPETNITTTTDKANVEPQTSETKKETTKAPNTTEESLDDYANKLRQEKGNEQPQTPAQKRSSKEQRRELKQRLGFEKPLYAKASASLSPVGVSTDRMINGDKLLSTNPNVVFTPASPTYSRSKHNMPLIVSVGVGIPIIERWLEINTGVQYTYLRSATETYAIGTDQMINKGIQELHYIGVPVSLASNFFESGRFRLYAAGGVALDKGLLNRTKTIYYKDDRSERSREQTDESIKGLQFSLNANVGGSVRIVEGLNFYLEPRLTWYIPNGKHPQPQSKLTDTPLQFNIVGGFRWNFTKKLK